MMLQKQRTPSIVFDKLDVLCVINSVREPWSEKSDASKIYTEAATTMNAWKVEKPLGSKSKSYVRAETKYIT